jgi:iron complex outermembrane receptor protein
VTSAQRWCDWLRRTSLCLGLIGSSPSTVAIEADKQSSIPAATVSLEEVVVTANRNLLNQSLSQSHTSYEVNLNDVVGFRRSLADLAVQAPGVSLNGQGGLFQSYSLRGLSRWRIRTEVNGIPLLIDRPAGSSASFIPPDLVSRITISQGPNSTLYGSDAMGGVVTLDTRPVGAPSYSLNWQDNDNSLSLTAKGAINSVLHGGVTLRRASEAEDAQRRPLNTGYEQVALALHARKEWETLSLSASWLPVRGRDIGKSSSDFPATSQARYPHDDHSLATVQLKQDDRWLARLYHHSQDWASEIQSTDAGIDRTRYQGDTVGALVYAATPFPAGEGRVGIEWLGRRGVSIDIETHIDSQGGASYENSVYGDQDDVGLFIDQVWRINSTTLELGGRYDHIEQQGGRAWANQMGVDDGAWSGHLAISRQLSSSWQLTGKLGTGFRFPTLTERFFNGTTPRGQLVGNPALKPETMESVELRTDYHHDALRVGITGYYNWLDDYIERIVLAPDIRSYTNVDRASIWGYEAVVDWQMTPNLHHRFLYQYQRGEDNAGRWLADLNPPLWRYGLSWETPYLQFQADLIHRPSRGEAGAGELPLPSATWVDGSLRFTLSRSLALTLFANNVFNEEYTGSADDRAAYQPGRTLGIGVHWQPQG